MNKMLIDKYFEIWISASPETWHALDMERFYAFTWSCITYGKKNRGYKWLREKIINSEHNLTRDDIDKYCNLFIRLQEFAKCRRFLGKDNRTY